MFFLNYVTPRAVARRCSPRPRSEVLSRAQFTVELPRAPKRPAAALHTDVNELSSNFLFLHILSIIAVHFEIFSINGKRYTIYHY